MLERAPSVWNLFWLSSPAIDAVPGSGSQWHLAYRPVPDAAASITADVMLEDVLHSKLLLHPLRFAAWFSNEDHSIYDAYDILGEDRWVTTVLRRAEESARRMASEVPALAGGNVYSLIGRQRAA